MELFLVEFEDTKESMAAALGWIQVFILYF